MPHHNHSPQRPKKTEAPSPMARHGYDNVHDAIQHFFSTFGMEEAEELLYKFLRYWITSNDIIYQDSTARDLVVLFYEKLRVLLEASYLLQKERIEKGATIHHVMP